MINSSAQILPHCLSAEFCTQGTKHRVIVGGVHLDIIRAILDGIAMAAIFNGSAAALVIANPRYLMDSYPKGIQKAAPEPMSKKEKRANRIFTVIVMGACWLYGVSSTLYGGIHTFRLLFCTAYIHWIIVNFGDFFLLDCLLFQKWTKLIVIPGTEDNPIYQTKNWMKVIGIPEHFLLWPFIIVPFFSLVQTGIVMLIQFLFSF